MVKENLFNKTILFLIYLYIPSIIFSNALSNILLLIFSFLSFYLILKKKVQIPIWMFYFFILICFYFLHPSNFKEFDLEKLIKIFFLIRFPLFVLLILYLANNENNKKHFKIIFKIILLFLALLSLDIIYQFIFKIDILGYKPGAWDVSIHDYKRYSGFFNDEYIGGAYLYLNSVLVLYHFSKDNTLPRYCFLLTMTSLLLIATILSGERVAVFKLSLIIIIFVFFFLPALKEKKFYFIIIFSLATIFTFNNDTLSKRYIDSTISEVGSLKNIKNNSYHYLHYKIALNIFKDNPVIGGGYKSFPKLCKRYDHGQYDLKNRKATRSCSTHPHNMVIQILSSGGLIAFIIFSLFIIKLTTNLFKDKNYLLIVFLVIYFLPIIPSGSIFSSWINFNFWFVIGLGLVFNQVFKSSKA
jgi:O-antigen ligase